VRRLIVTAKVVPSAPILVTLKMEALRSSERSVLTRATRRNILDDGIFQLHVGLRLRPAGQPSRSVIGISGSLEIRQHPVVIRVSGRRSL
jgi:hypothetical protein